MGAPIRVRGSGYWGTCFAIERNNAFRFVTARHVLLNCGCEPNTTSFEADLCDDLTDEHRYLLTDIVWDGDCDYAEFDCSFPARPYRVDISQIAKGRTIRTIGYLCSPPGVEPYMPDCQSPTDWSGVLQGERACPGGRRFLTVLLRCPEPNPHGLSGSPILAPIANEESVVGVFAKGDGIGIRLGAPVIG